jgi:hypothetical protein
MTSLFVTCTKNSRIYTLVGGVPGLPLVAYQLLGAYLARSVVWSVLHGPIAADFHAPLVGIHVPPQVATRVQPRL